MLKVDLKLEVYQSDNHNEESKSTIQSDLLQIWKLTNNPINLSNIACKRLNYRSWRLSKPKNTPSSLQDIQTQLLNVHNDDTWDGKSKLNSSSSNLNTTSSNISRKTSASVANTNNFNHSNVNYNSSTNVNGFGKRSLLGRHSVAGLSNGTQPLEKQFLAQRSSLFLNDSKGTLFYHGTKESLKVNDSEMESEYSDSDISEISEEDEDEDADFEDVPQYHRHRDHFQHHHIERTPIHKDDHKKDRHQQQEDNQIEKQAKLANPLSVFPSKIENSGDLFSSSKDHTSRSNMPSHPDISSRSGLESGATIASKPLTRARTDISPKSGIPASSSGSGSGSGSGLSSGPRRQVETEYGAGSQDTESKISNTTTISSKPSFVRGFTPMPPLLNTTEIHKRNAPENQNQNIFYIANSPSPTDAEVSKSKLSTGSEKLDRSRSDSLFKSISSLHKAISLNIANNSCSSTDISENENDNESAWQSFSEDEDAKDEQDAHRKFKKNELDFSKRTIMQPIRSLTDPISFKRDPEPTRGSISRSGGGDYLSGSSYQPRSLLSGLFLNRMSEAAEKPKLKRASTSEYGKTSIVFGKKNNSLDVTKRSQSYSSQISINANDESLPLGKKNSIVAMSDFKVVTQPLSLSVHSTTSSTVDIIEEEELSRKPNEPKNTTNELDNLSTSLSKYSAIVESSSSLSLNGLLLKSSRNLSGLFAVGSSTANSLRGGFSASNSTSNSNTASHNEVEISSKRSFIMNGLFKKLEDRRKNESQKEENKQKENNDEMKKNDKFFVSSADTNNSESNNKVTDTVDSPTVVKSKLASKIVNVRSKLSNELSESLKDSIIIDYKLGRIPLPEKIYENTLIDRPSAEESESYDYHSKGW